MKCPSCGNSSKYKYVRKREKTKSRDKTKRTDFRTKCSKCGYEGKE